MFPKTLESKSRLSDAQRRAIFAKLGSRGVRPSGRTTLKLRPRPAKTPNWGYEKIVGSGSSPSKSFLQRVKERVKKFLSRFSRKEESQEWESGWLLEALRSDAQRRAIFAKHRGGMQTPISPSWPSDSVLSPTPQGSVRRSRGISRRSS